MEASERRRIIVGELSRTTQPISAGTLANRCAVSRQIIVGDIALLRAGGMEITATPRGYILPRERTGILRTVVCSHTLDDMGKELEILVDNGCTVLDVDIDHPVYGHLTAPLHLSTRYEVQQFVEKVSSREARPLSALTEGVHLHHLQCQDEQAFQRAEAQLSAAGILYEEQR